MKTTYIVQIEVDEERIRKLYRNLGAPKDKMDNFIINELKMSDYIEVIKLDKVDVEK